MGLAPSEIKKLSMWEYQACIHGWNKSQSKTYSVEGDPLTDADYDALCELGDDWNGSD